MGVEWDHKLNNFDINNIFACKKTNIVVFKENYKDVGFDNKASTMSKDV